MKRRILPLLVLLLAGACSRGGPSPTPPSATIEVSPTLMATSTPKPTGSPVPRITIVPSATRMQVTVQAETVDLVATPTGTVEMIRTPIPSATPTERVVNAGPTETPIPTATLPDSPLPTPDSMGSPLSPPPATTPTDSNTKPTAEASGEEYTPTPTATLEPTGSGEGWRFENIFTFFDDESGEFYIQGELVNDTEDHARVTSFWPAILDGDDVPITSKDDANAIGKGYKELRESISLAPGQRLAFSYLVNVLNQGSIQDNYDCFVTTEPAPSGRDDLDITDDTFDSMDWPYSFFVEGTYVNPGQDLTEYVAVVVTLYDGDGRVIGVGWSYETTASSLAAGEHDFEVTVETWERLDQLELEVYNYKLQVFGY